MPVSYSFTVESVVKMTSAMATDYTMVRVEFSAQMKRSDPFASDDASNPANYTFSGGPRTISARSVTIVNPTTFDVEVDEMKNGDPYVVSVPLSFTDSGFVHTVEEAMASDAEADREPFTGLGDPPRVVSVSNPSDGVLHVDFSEDMLPDERLTSISSYSISPVGSSQPVVIKSINYDDLNPSRVSIRIDGGNSPYSLTAVGMTDLAGNEVVIHMGTQLFDISRPSKDELYSGRQVYFDTDLGSVNMSHSVLSERRIEDLSIIRANSVGIQEQFRIIAKALSEAGIDRDDRKLQFFKG